MSKYVKYPSYKDSGVEWLGEIPEYWQLATVSRLFDIKAGGDVKKEYFSEDQSTEYPYPIYTNSTKKAAVYGYSEKAFFHENTITVSGRGYIGYAIYREHKYDAIIRLLVLSPRNKKPCKFFMYYINDVLDFQVANTAISQLSTEQISPYKLVLPPFQEQQTIANYLDIATVKIDTLIEKQTKLIELLKEKRQAVISTAVTRGLDNTVAMKDSGVEWLGEIPEDWEVSKLRYVFSFGKGLTITKANLQDKGIPCVNYGEIHSKYGFEVDADKHDLKCVKESYLSDSKSSLLSMGDFVFADTSEDIEGAGNFTHVSSEAQLFAGYHTVIARQVGKQSFRFLAYLIDSVTFRTQIRLAVKGVKVFSITQAILRASIVWLPKVDEQQNIANYLDDRTSKIDNLIVKSTKAINLLKEKRTALISAVVTGKIDVRKQ